MGHSGLELQQPETRRACKTMIWKVRIRMTLSTSSQTFLLPTFGRLSAVAMVLIGVRSSLQAMLVCSLASDVACVHAMAFRSQNLCSPDSRSRKWSLVRMLEPGRW